MVNNFLNSSYCHQLVRNSTAIKGLSANISNSEASATIIGFGLFAAILALGFRFIRKVIYQDKNTLDVAFDAGGRVNVGLTASTIVSQWTWAATLLQSSTVASKYGISGSLWYASGATIQILLFAIISVQLKIKAPGAKTFLQVIKARFGSRTHKTFCFFALLTNIIVTAMLMLGGAAVMTSLIDGLSVEYATVLIAAVIGAYTFIGGLGATFYVSYVNTAVIYIIMIVVIMKIFKDPHSKDNPLGSTESLYRYLSCSVGPEENMDGSFLTILSKPGLMFGLINIVGNFGTVFVDQSYWQSSVAAKPKEGVLGFLLGGICWFAIPFALSTTMGLAYIALSTSQNQPLLSPADVDAGLVPPVVAQRLLGRTGEFLMVVMILMAVTSTGSAEVIAVTSILVYDIYQLYLKPYRMVLDSNSCILCGKGRGRMANPRDKCTCESMMYCGPCKSDDKQREQCKRALKPRYTCETHGRYREYSDYLSSLKNWCLLWTTVSILPLTVFLNLTGVSLSWVYLVMGILIGSAVIPITLTVSWERLTGNAMIIGSVSGTILAVVSWLSVASLYDGGLKDFLKNTGKEIPSLCGNLVAIVSGGAITVVISFVQTYKTGIPNRAEIWECTRDIDNPLSPWTELYEKELNLTGAHMLDNRPTLLEVERVFRGPKLTAYIASICLSVFLVVIIPCILISIQTMDETQFEVWITTAIVWAFLATISMIITPVVTEAWDIHQAFKQRRSVSPNLWTKPATTNSRSKQSSQSSVYKKTQLADSRNSKTDKPIHFTDPSMIPDNEENVKLHMEENLNKINQNYPEPGRNTPVVF